MVNQFVAVIPAAGIGERFEDITPKQYIDINGKTVIERSVEHILNHPSCLELVVCLSSNDSWFRDIVMFQNPKVKTIIGGNTRGESVDNGVKFFEERNLEFSHFLIQDAVRRPDELSGGEQQRVAIARAFVNRPMLLIADEPTGNLDPNTSVGIMKLLDRINRLGTTVIMSTHDAQIVDQMRRRVIELETGHLVRDQSRGVYGYAR